MYTGNRIKGSNPFLSAKAERPRVARAFRFVLDKRDSKGGEANAAVRRPPAPESDGHGTPKLGRPAALTAAGSAAGPDMA